MIGRTISHYKILEKLGEGGMGVVYKAEDTKLMRTVALKFLPEELTRDAEAKTRFLHEARAASSLDHQNICNIHEVDETEDGRVFISMACYEGETLKEKIGSGPLNLNEAIRIAMQIASGLQEAHEKGIVHRDIKPDNVMLTPKGLTKVMDFGIARSAGGTTITREGSTLGTTAYMSPEQARGERVDHRSDIWSLGVVLYEMITGTLPFKGDHEPAIVYSVMNEEAEPVTALRTGVPMELERIVCKALAKDPGERYQHADEMLADLCSLQRETGEATTPRPTVPRTQGERRPRWWWTAAVVAVAAAVLFFGKGLWLEHQPPAEAAVNSLAIMYFDNLVSPEDPERLGEIATNLLITDLSESRFVHVISSQRLYDILKLLGREGVKRIDRDVASRVAEKAKARWMLLGSILQVEPSILITAQLVEVETGNIVASQRISGEPEESIFSLVDRLTVEVRKDLTLPVEAQDEEDRPVADVTTHSPEAYRFYLQGMDDLHKLYFGDARLDFEKAVEYDSTFAMAHFEIALIAYYIDSSNQRKLLDRALRFSKNASDRERRHIEAQNALLSNDYDRGIRKLKELLEIYPDDKGAWLRLGITYGITMHHPEESIPCFERAIEIDPLYKIAYNILAYVYHEAGNIDKSTQIIDKYRELAPDEANPYDTRGDLYAYSGKIGEAIESYRQAENVRLGYSTDKLGCMYLLTMKYQEAADCFQQRLSSPDIDTRSWGRMRLALVPLHQGKFKESLELLEQGIAADRIEGAGEGLVMKRLLKALIFEELGDRESALSEVEMISPIPIMAQDEDYCYKTEYTIRLLAGLGRRAAGRAL